MILMMIMKLTINSNYDDIMMIMIMMRENNDERK